MSTLNLDPTYLDGVFTELGAMDILLDDDPLPFGPKRLNGKIAESRRMLSRCEAVFVQSSQYLSQFKRDLRKESLELDLCKKHLLANDPIVRAERSVSDRDAAATMQLRVRVNEVNRLEQLVADMEDLLAVIKAKRADLRDIQGRLRDQIRLCQNEIGLGDRWGSQVPGARPLDHSLPSSADVKEVDDLIANLGKDETHLPVGETPEDEVDEEADREALVQGVQAPAEPELAKAAPEPLPQPVLVEIQVAPTPPSATPVEPSTSEIVVLGRPPLSDNVLAAGLTALAVVALPPPLEPSAPPPSVRPPAPPMTDDDDHEEDDDASGLFPEDEDPEEAPPLPAILRGTSSQAEVDKFLGSAEEPVPLKGGQRRKQEEADSLDIEDILSHF